MARCRLRLSEFEFDVIPRARIKKQAADTLSGLPRDTADSNPIEDDILIVAIDATSNHNNEIVLHEVDCQATVYVVEDKDNF